MPLLSLNKIKSLPVYEETNSYAGGIYFVFYKRELVYIGSCECLKIRLSGRKTHHILKTLQPKKTKIYLYKDCSHCPDKILF